MAAEYSYTGTQTVNAGQPALFTEARVPCTQGLVFHQNGSGIFLLASRVARPTCCCRKAYETLYRVDVGGNVAIPEGGTVEEIQLAISVEGEVDPISLIRITPAAAQVFSAFQRSLIVPVPNICGCSSVSFRNISPTNAPVDIQNLNIIFTPAGAQVAN